MKRFNIFFCTILALSLSCTISCISTSTVTSALSTAKGTQTVEKVDIEGLNLQQAKLKTRIVSSLVHMLTAQEKVLDATGDKNAAGKVANQINSLKKGNVLDEEIEKSIGLTKENNKTISEKETVMGNLNSSSKKKIAQSLVPYALGVVDMTKLNKDFTDWLDQAKSAVSSADLNSIISIKKNLSFGMSLAPKVPALTTQSLSTTHKLIAFCKRNKLDISGAEDALGEL